MGDVFQFLNLTWPLMNVFYRISKLQFSKQPTNCPILFLSRLLRWNHKSELFVQIILFTISSISQNIKISVFSSSGTYSFWIFNLYVLFVLEICPDPLSWMFFFVVFLRKNFSNISKNSFICPYFYHQISLYKNHT